jgi:hypothetical protein
MLMDEIREKVNSKKKDKKDASQPGLAYQTWDLGHLFPDYETEINPYKANKKNNKT